MKKCLLKSLFIAFFTCVTMSGFGQIIRTIAGNGVQAYTGDGGESVLASFGNVWGIAINDSGEIFIADNFYNTIRKVTNRGMVSTYCGNGYPYYTGDGGPASAAQIAAPYSLTFDTSGNLYIADAANYVIRKIDTHDTITTFAGNHTTGYFNGNGIPAISAKIGASGVATDKHGNLFIADGNTRIRKVNPAGIITTVVGNGSVGFGGDGGPATAATLDGCVGVCVDTAGNIYVADYNNVRVRKVNAATGIITTFAGTGTSGSTGDGGQATAARLNGPTSVRIDPQGNVVIVDQSNGRLRKVSSTGIITTIAGVGGAAGFSGDGGPATAAKLANPNDVVWDKYGNMFIADRGAPASTYGRRVREVFKIDTLHLTANPGDTVCGHSHLTFTAHEVGGKHYLSFYRWKLNGVVVGGNSPFYNSDSVRNGDIITCSMYDTASGGFTIAVSDTIRMVVRPVVVPAVMLASTGDTLCAGQPVTLTATNTNGGTSPVYHWYRFGVLVSTGPVYTYIPAVGDIITCVLVSNAVCAYPDSVSASRSMVINTSYPPSVTLDPHPNDTIAYWGEIITLFTELTYQGSSPTFQWYRNGAPIPGATNRTYNETVYHDDTLYCVMYSNAPCVVPDHDTSDIMYISIGRLLVSSAHKQNANISILPNPNNGSFALTGLLGGNIARISIANMLGKVIYTKDEPLTNGRLNATVMPEKQLPPGMYLLSLTYDGGNQVLHFVVK